MENGCYCILDKQKGLLGWLQYMFIYIPYHMIFVWATWWMLQVKQDFLPLCSSQICQWGSYYSICSILSTIVFVFMFLLSFGHCNVWPSMLDKLLLVIHWYFKLCLTLLTWYNKRRKNQLHSKIILIHVPVENSR